jgi:hypothetical protein
MAGAGPGFTSELYVKGSDLVCRHGCVNSTNFSISVGLDYSLINITYIFESQRGLRVLLRHCYGVTD